ncbi:MAG TPA: hypothetical protein QF646_06950 [Candidatus Poseidoniales archaeon]|nr:hypothetical protein [Candidatus Poseidoniales archaeon]
MEDPLGEVAATLEERHVSAADGWRLRTFNWTPTDPEAARRRPVIVVAGWTSVVEGWKPLLLKWVEQRPVHYIETREKNRTKAPTGHRQRVVDFEMEKHCSDLAAAVHDLDLDASECDWLASSLGSTVLLHGFKEGILQGRSAFLIAPNGEFKFPAWAIPFIWLPWWFYWPGIRILVIPYLKLRVKEPEQYVRYRRSIMSADLKRLKLSTKANRGYAIWEGLERVEIPCAICIAASDTLHSSGEAERIAETLPHGKIVEVQSNQFAHEADVIPVIESWQNEAENE